jgi:hypothetical protein
VAAVITDLASLSPSVVLRCKSTMSPRILAFVKVGSHFPMFEGSSDDEDDGSLNLTKSSGV